MNYLVLLPQMILFGLALVVLLADLVLPDDKKHYLTGVGVAGLVGVIVTAIIFRDENALLFNKMISVDALSFFFTLFLAVVGIMVVLISKDWIEKPSFLGEYYTMLLFAFLGLMLSSMAVELISVYIALELASLSLYVLITRAERSRKAGEAGLKYLLLSAMSTAVLLYGLSLLYGLTGTTYLAEMPAALSSLTFQPALILALMFTLAGFGFKLALVPFQMWVPDVYEGAPAPVTALLATASKAVGLVLLMRVFLGSLIIVKDYWVLPLAVLAAFTMTFGNLVALVQTNIKRLLAYSSIAHAGYMMLGVIALSKQGLTGVLVYLVSYAVASIGAFTAVVIFSSQTGSDEITDYGGLAQRAPGLAFGLTVCLMSMAGLPLFAGFMAKFYVFLAAFSRDLNWLVAIALLNSAISLYYYIMVVKEVYVSGPAKREAIDWPDNSRVVIFLVSAAVLILGIYPTPLINAAQTVIKTVFNGLP